MTDLHMHTKYSDGTDEIINILKKAEKMNLKYIPNISRSQRQQVYAICKKTNIA